MHKKYTYKNGKKYGPYFYENRRVGEKVFTNYLGTSDPKDSFKNKIVSKKMFWTVIITLLLVIVGLLLVLDIFLQFSPTGWIVLNLQPKYHVGENLSGFVDLKFNAGELIPKDSELYVNLGEQKKVFTLSELVESHVINGDFYARDTFISGNGEGYGLMGEKISYPDLNLMVRIYSSESSSNIDSSGQSQEDNFEEPIEETPEEIDSETTEEPSTEESLDSSESSSESNEDSSSSDDSSSESSSESNEDSSSSDDSSSESSSESNEDSSSSDDSSESSNSISITGEAVSEEEYILEETINKNNPFSYNLEENQDFEIIEVSSKNGEKLSNNLISSFRDGNKVTFSTDYSVKEKGFGEDFVSDESSLISVDLSKLNILAENSILEIKLIYQDNIISSSQKNILIISSEKNLSLEEAVNISISPNVSIILLKDIPTLRIKSGESASLNLSEYFENAENYGFNADNLSASFDGSILNLTADSGFRGSRKVKILAYREDEVLESNSFNVLVSSGAINITILRNEIKLGELVKWTANISLEISENVSFELPVQANNITVSAIENGNMQEISADIKKILKGSGEIIQESENNYESQENNENFSPLTGNVISDIRLKKRESILFNFFKKLFSFIGKVISEEELISNSIDSDQGSIEVSIDSIEDSTNYVVEYYTEAPAAIEENTSYGKQVVISAPSELNYTDILSFANIPEVYAVGEENKIKIYWVENKSYVNFDAYDMDGNDKLDYVEWITAHLSNQTFEIILITKAEHLDSERNFVEDVYDYVKTRDNNWSGAISSGEYVRVKFEKNLTSSNDITVYARNACNNSININNIDVPCDVYYKKLRIDALRRENG